MPGRLHVRAWKLAVAVSLLIGLTSLPGPVPARAGVAGLLNPGFESGTLNGAPQSWTVGPVSDAAVVVGAEGPAQFQTYADKNNGDFVGNITVTPFKGSKMLRLGTPKAINEKQNAGDNVVSQVFVADHTPLKFAFRLFSWEERNLDLFFFDLQPTPACAPACLPQLAAPVSVTMPDGSSRGCSALPCSFSQDVGKQGQFLVMPDWKVVEIGLVVGQQYTLTFKVAGTDNSAHATWAYFDANIPPVATVSLDNPSPKTNDKLTATATKSDADVGDTVTLTYVWKVNGATKKTTAATSSLTDTFDLSGAGNGDKGQTITVEVTPNDGTDNGAMVSASATVVNTPPVATVSLNNPLPKTNDTLTATATKSDADGDPVTVTYVWKVKDGVTGLVKKTIPGGAGPTDMFDLSLGGNGDKGDTITVEVTPSDGTENGVMVSASATVVNTPPVATVSLNDHSPKTNDKLTATATTSDADGDPVTVTYVWKVNGVMKNTPAATSSLTDTFDLSLAGNGDKGDTITVEVTPNDGAVNGDMASDTARVVGSPPVALFKFDPASPIEGLKVHFTDQSFDIDPGDTIVKWLWTFTGEFDPGHVDLTTGNPLETISTGSQNPDFIFPNEGPFTVCLTVTGNDGLTGGPACTGGTAANGAPVAPLSVINAGMLVKALNLEVVAGQPVTLYGRFLDPGVFDTHNNSGTFWTVGGVTVDAVVEELHGVGRVTGTFTPTTPGTLSGTLWVSDNYVSARASFLVHVLGALDLRELPPNDSAASAANIASGQVIRSSLPIPTDVDFFRIVGPGTNGAWLAGSEVLLTLKDLPADFDLFALVKVPGGGTPADFEWGDFEWGDFEWGDFEWGDFEWGGYGPGFMPLAFENLPLSLMHFGVPDGQQLNVLDVTRAELGLSGSDLSVAGFSVNRGIAEDKVLIRIGVPNTEVIALVRGYNGSFSSAPYSLQVEASVPADIETVVGTAGTGCKGTPLVASPTPFTPIQHPGLDNTLFVTQKDRFIALYGSTRWEAMLAKLTDLANYTPGGVTGKIISVSSSIYDSWDANPCSVDAANAVAQSIRAEIVGQLNQYPSLQNVVLVGSDSIIPYRRAPNGTQFNERHYFLDSFLIPGTPLFASLWENMNLTDDYYVDLAPTPAATGEIYIPDRAIGRLVETPEEIGAQADAFMRSNGFLDQGTGLVTGYDFFADGALATAANLAAKGLTVDSTLASGTWNAALLQSKLLPASGAAPGVAAAYAHYTHYAALSAFGFTNRVQSDLLSSLAVANAVRGGQPALLRRLIFTMGCHAGLSVPDASSLAPDPGSGIDPRLDLPQAFARQQAILIASTGYGLGENTGQGGSELLLTIFANQLNNGVRAGEALRQAKMAYLSGLFVITQIDVKSSIQTVFYGLPMYQVTTPSAPPPPQPGVGGRLTVMDAGSTTTIPYSLTPLTSADGTYITSNDGAQVTSGRPVQPKVLKTNLTPAGGPAVHGVLVTGGTYTETSSFDPVIATPTYEWARGSDELQLCVNGFWPSVLAGVNGLDIDGNGSPDLQTLIVVPGSFRCDGLTGGKVKGTERLYTSLNVELVRSGLADFKPPDITSVALTGVSDGSVNVVVQASDANTGGSGISRIVVLLTTPDPITPASGTVTSIDCPAAGAARCPPSAPGTQTVNIPGPIPAETLVDLEVVDGAGNVANATAKSGGGFSFLAVNLGPDQLYAPGVPVHFPVTVPDFNPAVHPFYFVDFGDGGLESGPVPSGAFSIHHTYQRDAQGNALPSFTARIQVTNDKGGTGNDEVKLTLCADVAGDYGVDPNADLVACSVTTNAGTSSTLPSGNATTMTIKLRVAGSIALGQAIYQYRVKINTGVAAFQLRYDNGKVTGLPSATASLSASVPGGPKDELTFTFNLADIGRGSGDFILVSFETQAGKPGEPNVGLPDDMPDSGFFGYVIH